MSYFITPASRPSFVSKGLTFLAEPKFIIADDLLLFFDWEIKCAYVLPPISIKIVKITRRAKMREVFDLTDYFSLPEVMEFPETKAEPKKCNAIIIAQGQLKLPSSENIPLGQFRLVIELVCLGQAHMISQNFVLIRKI